MKLLLVNAEVEGRSGQAIRVRHGWVVAVASRLKAGVGEEVLDAAGGAVIAGLHDHHVHLRAGAVAGKSIDVSPYLVANRSELACKLRAASAAKDGWVRAVGYHESVAGLLDARKLDELVADRPLRVQHRSGVLWMLNSEALDRAGVAGWPDAGVERDASGRPTGRLWRLDAKLATAVPRLEPDLASVVGRALERGITGFTDADPQRSPTDAERLADAVPQRLHLMGPLGLSFERTERVTLGPVKILLDDDRLPGVDDLVAVAEAAHQRGRAVAVHCVTRTQVVLALAALEAAGPARGSLTERDRIEHGSVIPAELIPALARRRLLVVTQPELVASRGDQYVTDVEADDVGDLYRLASLREAGVAVAIGTDAPYGDPDPWRSIRAAVERRTRSGTVVGAQEAVDAGTALSLLQGEPTAPDRPRLVAPGARADLCVLAAPLQAVLTDPTAEAVSATILAGTPAWTA